MSGSKAFKFALFAVSKTLPAAKSSTMSHIPKQLLSASAPSFNACAPALSRTHGTLSSLFTTVQKKHMVQQAAHISMMNKNYSTEVDKEIAKFLEKEIQYETSRSSSELPKIPGFEIITNGGDVTLKKATGSENVVVKLSVNGAVDSILAEGEAGKQDEPPQMVCRPPFDVEIQKSGTVLAFQCSFPAPEEPFEDAEEYAKRDQEAERIEDQFEIQEVAFHDGEWKDTTYSVSAATMDAELFDLLMDMLDERGINDEFIAHLVDFCTAYENKLYIGFLNKLKSVAEN